MSKFKVGDKARVKLTGKVGVISRAEEWRTFPYMLKDDPKKEPFGESELERVESVREFIVIRRDDRDVIASHKRGDEIVKTAKATCAPSDEFNFETGAKLAFDRLVGREEPKPKTAAPAPKFKVGDRVVTQFGNGTVVEINYQHELIAYTVEHDNTSDMLHSGRWDILNGPGFSPNRCYFFSEHDLSPAPEPKYYSGKVFAVSSNIRPSIIDVRNGHVFEIKDGLLVGETRKYQLWNLVGNPIMSFKDFCNKWYSTNWQEVKE